MLLSSLLWLAEEDEDAFDGLAATTSTDPEPTPTMRRPAGKRPVSQAEMAMAGMAAQLAARGGGLLPSQLKARPTLRKPEPAAIKEEPVAPQASKNTPIDAKATAKAAPKPAPKPKPKPKPAKQLIKQGSAGESLS